jgi:hypothetical protein
MITFLQNNKSTPSQPIIITNNSSSYSTKIRHGSITTKHPVTDFHFDTERRAPQQPANEPTTHATS